MIPALDHHVAADRPAAILTPHGRGFDRSLEAATGIDPKARRLRTEGERIARLLAEAALVNLAFLSQQELAGKSAEKATVAAAERESLTPEGKPSPSAALASQGARGADPRAESEVPRTDAPIERDAPSRPERSSSPQASPSPAPAAGAGPDREARPEAVSSRETLPPPVVIPAASSAPTAGRATSVQDPLARLGGLAQRTRETAIPHRPAKPTLQRAAPERFQAVLARGLAAAMRARGGEVAMKLEPRSLGTLRIRLEFAGTRVSGVLEASNAPARDLLDRSLAVLRAGLEARGLNADGLEVRLADAAEPVRDGRDESSVVGDDREHAERQGGGGGGDRPAEHEEPAEVPVMLAEPGRLDAIA